MEAYIQQKIMQRPQRHISFAEYMNDCLYHPRRGYYMREGNKIGKDGDYYTTVAAHPVFAETLAHFSARWFEQWEQPVHFCEMGAGTGAFAETFLHTLVEQYPHLYGRARYIVIEKSAFLREQQAQRLQPYTDRVQWHASLPDLSQSSHMDLDTDFKADMPTGTPVDRRTNSFKGIFFSNELVDAFPVHIVEKREGKVCEVRITWNETKEKLEEIWVPLQSRAWQTTTSRLDAANASMAITDYLHRHDIHLAEGQRLEIPLAAERWVKEVAQWLGEGLWLTFDYGYTWEEFMLPQHRRGTIMCYHRHKVDEDPLQLAGKKDITYHVQFDALSRTAADFGWHKLRLAEQADFLLSAGILDLLKEHQGGDPFRNETIKKNRAIRQLIQPGGLSQSFRVLVLGKNLTADMKKLVRPYRFSDLRNI